MYMYVWMYKLCVRDGKAVRKRMLQKEKVRMNVQ